MADLTDAEIEAATARGAALRLTQPRARAAHYDAVADRVVIELTTGATYSFAPWLAQGLRGAGAADLAEVEVLGRGFALHWERSTSTSLSRACWWGGSGRNGGWRRCRWRRSRALRPKALNQFLS